jgi:hypothetical protein
MKILVTRQPANKQGIDVVDPLLVTEPAGVARGTREIDYHGSNRSQERGNCPQLPYMPTGSLINVTEAGGSYRGKLQSYALTVDIGEDGRDFSVTTAISIEMEMR